MAARPQLQEAQFACFEDEGRADASRSLSGADLAAEGGVPTFSVSFPAGVRSQPPKSFARVRALECSGSGSFYFQNEALRDRFVCWRVLKNVVVLREWSLHTSLRHNGVRLEFPAPVVATGVYAVESWASHAVTVSVVTHAGTIHRFSYAISGDASDSIFAQADARAFPTPKPATSQRCDVLRTLAGHEILTVALWVNEFNLVLGTDAGRVVGVNFGLPQALEMQEFAFSDESVVSWLWHGLLKSTAARFHGEDGSSAEPKATGSAVVAMACFPIEAEDENDDGSSEDVCVVTVSADCVLRAWSYSSQSCLGRQQLRPLVLNVAADDKDDDAGGWDDADLDGDDSADSIGIYATHAKVVALPPTASSNCRLLVHLDTTAASSTDIFLLRGDVASSSASSAGAGGQELALVAARVFTVQPAVTNDRLRMVDFAVDKNLLFSSWRSADGDQLFTHANPMALTGPRTVPGQRVSSLGMQMQRYEAEDDDWLVDLKEDDGVLPLIDDFFAERVLLPGRFSRQNIRMAVEEAQGSAGLGSRGVFTSHESKYKDLLVRLVASRCVDSAGAAAVRHGTSPSVLRVRVWKELLALCTKHWRCESVPIGFATTANALLPGSPVLLRRNRVSLLFPSAASITAALVRQPPAPSASTSDECVRDVVADVLPIFDAFPSQSFQSFVHREVADVAGDWKVESFVALARHCVRLGLRTDFTASSPTTGEAMSAELVLMRAVLRLSKLLGGDPDFQDQVFRDLVARLFPFELWRGSGSFQPASPLRRDEDESSGEDDMDAMDDDADEDIGMGDGGPEYYAAGRAFFAGHEMSFALHQVASRAIDDMCSQSLRVVLCLAYLVDTRPAFLSAATVAKIGRVYLPKAITVYQRWRLSRWLVSQCLAQSSAEADAWPSASSSSSLLPPLLQLFLLDVNARLNKSRALKRALSVLQLALVNGSVRSEEAHGVLATFTREVLQLVSQPNEPLVRFLQQRRQFRLLRAMFGCSLSDLSLHGSAGAAKLEAGSTPHSQQVARYVRSIGECLACEGQEAATRALQDEDARDHARWCFQQAIRCFSMCLSGLFGEQSASSPAKAAERFIYDVVGLLKETVPRGFLDQLLGFLWAVATQALGRLDAGLSLSLSHALQSFVWVNVFKYSVEEQLFRDAHLALMHTVDLSAALQGSDAAAEAETTASECVNYLVKELCRYGRLDLICDLQWGALEPHVETHLVWQAANANVLATGKTESGLDAAAMRYYNLLFAFYARKQQPANAASSLYALALRLRLARATSRTALETQRNALHAACNALRVLPAENQWVVRKLHTEELSRPRAEAATTCASPSLSVVTREDMQREVAVLDGKLRLLAVGHSESVLLSSMDGDEVVALLVDAVYTSSGGGATATTTTTTTRAERRRAGVLTIELAAAIASRGSTHSRSSLTKSLARYCVASEHPAAPASTDKELLWELLELLLDATHSLEQYEVAAEAVLDFWQQQGRKLALPSWLYTRLASATTGSPAKLLALFLHHGLLLEALQLVEELLPDDASMRGGAATAPFGFQKQSAPSSRPPTLPWIPYNLIDALLDSTAAVLSNGSDSGLAVASLGQLRERESRLRQQLTRYFRAAGALQQAQEAAGLARSGGMTPMSTSSSFF